MSIGQELREISSKAKNNKEEGLTDDVYPILITYAREVAETGLIGFNIYSYDNSDKKLEGLFNKIKECEEILFNRLKEEDINIVFHNDSSYWDNSYYTISWE